MTEEETPKMTDEKTPEDAPAEEASTEPSGPAGNRSVAILGPDRPLVGNSDDGHAI